MGSDDALDCPFRVYFMKIELPAADARALLAMALVRLSHKATSKVMLSALLVESAVLYSPLCLQRMRVAQYN